MWFACPYLRADVELTEERQVHIERRHAELGQQLHEQIRLALLEPDEVLTVLAEKHGFSRWTGTIGFGRFVVVIVREDETSRYWISTAYTTVDPPKLEDL